MIRHGSFGDIPKVVKLGAKFSKINGFSGEYCEQSTREFVVRLIESDDGLLLVNNEVTAILGAMLTPVYFNKNHMTCTELFWYSEKPGDGLRLFKVCENWAVSKNCKTIHMISLAEHTGVEKVYDRKGYKKLETIYYKEL